VEREGAIGALGEKGLGGGEHVRKPTSIKFHTAVSKCKKRAGQESESGTVKKKILLRLLSPGKRSLNNQTVRDIPFLGSRKKASQ